MSFFGAIKPSIDAFVGLLWKTPYKLSKTKKANIRKRLKMVESNLNELNKANIPIKALDRLNMIPRYSHLRPIDKYTFWHDKTQGRKPVHFYPKHTKVDVPNKVRPNYEFL